MRARLGFYIDGKEPGGTGIEPRTFGTEGEELASELPRQMRERILISVYSLSLLIEVA